MKVCVKVYSSSKYNHGSEKVAECEYNIRSYEVREIPDAELYLMGFDEVDPCGEYLILSLEGGETSTFRNSLCDMFRV